jgi:hypothetical protein
MLQYHFKSDCGRRGGERGSVMEGMDKPRYVVCIYGNVTTQTLAQLLSTNKNALKGDQGKFLNENKTPNNFS